jgi:cytochrome P450
MATTTVRPTMPEFDPFSPEFQANPYPVLAKARSECPIFYYAPLNFWAITRYEDVSKIIGDYKTFSSRAFGVVPVPEQFADRVPSNFFSLVLIASDPPSHTVLRKNAQKALTRPRIAAMESTIRAISDELIDSFIDEGHCDIVGQFTNELTLRTIVQMVGLPEEDLPRFREWSRDVVALITPRALTDGEDAPSKPMSEAERLERYGRIADARDYFRALVDSRRVEPREDLVSALVAVRDDEGNDALDRERIVSHLSEVITAGSITTSNLMAQMVRLFDANPDQFELVKREPELMEGAVEEALRHSGSTLGVFRVATQEVKIGDVTIPAGSLVWACYASTGRDERRFPDPDRFDIRRIDAEEHLEFGIGRHFCLGAPLARLETRIGMQRLFERIPGIRVTSQQKLEYVPALVTSSLRALQVEWDAPGASAA